MGYKKLNDKKNKLLYLQINEINRQFLIQGSKKYNCRNIYNFLKDKHIITTRSPDKIQDKNLDPWVQSVSINTGKESKKHKIYNIGQYVSKDTVQIWDILANKNINCSVWGTMNSIMKKNKNLKLYFPDPWNFNAKAYPEKFNNFLALPKYFAQNYLDFKNFKFLILIIKFSFSLIFSSFFLYFFKNISFFYKIIKVGGTKNFNLFFIFDLISLVLFKHEIKKNSSEFALIFLNSFAHFQHNNWDEKENEKIYFFTANKIFEIINELAKDFDHILVANGFTQKKIKKIYTLRPFNPENFLRNKLNLKFKKLDQDMTNGGFVYFDNNLQADLSIKKMRSLNIFGINFFQIKKISNKKIFYKINIFSKKIISTNIFSRLTKKNLDKYFITNKYKLKKESNFNAELWKDIYFIKTTGRHISEGFLLMNYVDKKIVFKKFIQNHKIFNVIKNNFFVTN